MEENKNNNDEEENKNELLSYKTSVAMFSYHRLDFKNEMIRLIIIKKSIQQLLTSIYLNNEIITDAMCANNNDANIINVM